MHVKNLALCVWEWRRYTIQYDDVVVLVWWNNWLSPLDSSFHRFPGAQIFIYKRLLISSSRKALRWRDSRNSQRGPCASDTQLDLLKAWCPRWWTKPNAMRIEVMRGHTKSLDANDKLIQTRPHERDTIASRKRQVVMRKVKSTILA